MAEEIHELTICTHLMPPVTLPVVSNQTWNIQGRNWQPLQAGFRTHPHPELKIKHLPAHCDIPSQFIGHWQLRSKGKQCCVWVQVHSDHFLNLPSRSRTLRRAFEGDGQNLVLARDLFVRPAVVECCPLATTWPVHSWTHNRCDYPHDTQTRLIH